MPTKHATCRQKSLQEWFEVKLPEQGNGIKLRQLNQLRLRCSKLESKFPERYSEIYST